MMWAMLKTERYLLSVSYKPNGDVYEKYTLIDRKRMRSNPLYTSRVELPVTTKEKVALIKLRKGSYADTELGMWIGERHLVVYLDESEYKMLKELVDGDARK